MAIKKYHESKNLFDVSTQTVGYFVRAGNTTAEKPLGNIELNAQYNLSAYIAVIPNTIYTIKYPVASVVNGAGLVYYSDNSGTTISGISLGDQGQTYTFTTPNNCNYIRFSYANSAGTDVMLNTGSTALPYEPYYTPYFEEIGYKKYESATDTITSFPADVIADGQSASAIIKGNLSQSGTPTPSSPIYPSECGDKTANLFDKANDIEAYYLDSTTGEYKSTGSTSRTTLIKCTGNETYSISAFSRTFRVAFYSIKPTNGTAAISFNNFDYGAYGEHSKTVTAPQNAEYMAFFCYNSGTEAQTYTENEIFSTVMINTGSTALPFEPYGYKIPILSGGVTTNKYLGEEQTTRQIKQLVFDGTEGWTYAPNGQYQRVRIDLGENAAVTECMCNQYPYRFEFSDCNIFVHSNLAQLSICDSANATSQANWITYLQQQYANGTPVTVWYVLETATTGTVNEPIRKIGTYADSVSVTGIPTTGTAEQFDVDTTLKPSEVDLTYHGWHEHSDTKYTT